MEYKKLEVPIYWMGYVKGKFTKRKFVECQAKYPSWCRAEDNRTIRRITNRSKDHFNEVQIVGGYSIYSYKEFTKEQEVEFFKEIIKRNVKVCIDNAEGKYISCALVFYIGNKKTVYVVDEAIKEQSPEHFKELELLKEVLE